MGWFRIASTQPNHVEALDEAIQTNLRLSLVSVFLKQFFFLKKTKIKILLLYFIEINLFENLNLFKINFMLYFLIIFLHSYKFFKPTIRKQIKIK